MVQQRRREFVAWVVLLVSFFTFVVLVVGAMLVVRSVRETAMEDKDALLAFGRGTVLVKEEGQPSWVSVPSGYTLRRGASIRSDDNYEALVRLFDGSRVTLYPRSEMVLETTAVARFLDGKQDIVLGLRQGTARIEVAATQGTRRFEVRSALGSASLDAGEFAVAATDDAFRLRVRDGLGAVVSSPEGAVQLMAGQRTEVVSGKPPLPPEDAIEELIFNGDFAMGLTGWQTGNELGFAEGFDIAGAATTTFDGQQSAVQLTRRGSKGTHSETYVRQQIDRDVSDFTYLRLSFQLKIVQHNLSGGGYLGSEYPVLVRLVYRGVDGETYKVWGFYYQNRANNRTDNGRLVPEKTWVTYTVPENLMQVSPRPRRIVSIQIGASGWDYESLVSGVSLEGE